MHAEHALASAIAARRWRAGESVAVRALGQGSNNTTYLAAGPEECVVIKLSRPHREDGALGEYRKEAWCAGQARVLGVHTPEVLEVGVLSERAFEILSFVEGRPPTLSEARSTWRMLGGYARHIHSIPVRGWGGRLVDDGCFGESWKLHLEYNVAALAPDDELIAREVLNSASSQRFKKGLEHLLRGAFTFGLCHGDLALANTLVDAGGTPWLLDWGCAVAHVVPHYEINEILRSPVAQPLESFLDGYGISPGTYGAMGADLRLLAALREVDTLRWALEKKPDMIAELAVRARHAVARID